MSLYMYNIAAILLTLVSTDLINLNLRAHAALE